MAPPWEAAVVDLVRDLGAIARGLDRAERLARGTDALDEARRAERAATTAVSRIVVRQDVPSDEIDATVREARAAVARARELIVGITEDDLAGELLDPAAMHAARLRELLLHLRTPLEE